MHLTSPKMLPQHRLLLCRPLAQLGCGCCGGRDAGGGSWQGRGSDKAGRWKPVPVLSRKHKDDGYLDGTTICGKTA